jgi:hypothetical protein
MISSNPHQTLKRRRRMQVEMEELQNQANDFILITYSGE